MEIKGKVHCFFEQSGTFKNEFIKLGIPAEDYDIQDNFGETNHVVDLFKAIEDAYDDKPSLFDQVGGGGFNNCFFPMYILLCNKSDGNVLGMYQLSKTLYKRSNRADFEKGKQKRVLFQSCS